MHTRSINSGSLHTNACREHKREGRNRPRESFSRRCPVIKRFPQKASFELRRRSGPKYTMARAIKLGRCRKSGQEKKVGQSRILAPFLFAGRVEFGRPHLKPFSTNTTTQTQGREDLCRGLICLVTCFSVGGTKVLVKFPFCSL